MKVMNSSSLLVAATILLLSVVSHATTCTTDVAIPWPGTTDGETDDECNGDATCLAAQAQANCIALNAVSDTPRDCSSADSVSNNVKRQTGTLDCAANESCVLYSDTVLTTLLCLDPLTGDYRDQAGGRGNANSRVYTAVDGAVQTFTGTETPTLKGYTAVRTTTVILTAPGGSATQTVTSTITETGSGEAPATVGTSATSSSSASSGSAASSGGSSSSTASRGAGAEATESSTGAAAGAQSSTRTAATSSRPSSSVASSESQTSGVAQQTAGAIVNKLANRALSFVAGVPFLVAVL